MKYFFVLYTTGMMYFIFCFSIFAIYAYFVKTYYKWRSNMECAKFHIEKHGFCQETLNNLNQLLKAPLKISTSIEYRNAITYWQQEGLWHSEMASKYTKKVPKWYQERWLKNND